MASRNARIGLVLFAVYLLFYGGFVVLNAFAPETMEPTTYAGGMNVATLYGMCLILGAFLLAMVYGWLCGG